jgi:riboflavin kinase/FMN adenylyltransferase
LNLLCPHQLIPKSGIYLSKVIWQENVFFGLTNIGCSPTVKNTGVIEIETHILDFQDNLYGQIMELDLLSYLREEKMFKNVDELKTAIQNDIALARVMLKEFSG